MIKKLFHKSFSVLLALLVLTSTVSFTVEKHFCGDTLIDASVFAKASKCAMEAFEKEQEAITNKKCCTDEVDIVQGQDDLRHTSFEDLDFQKQFFITTFVYVFVNPFEGLPKHTIPHKNYSPPNLVVDLQVLDQVFLI